MNIIVINKEIFQNRPPVISTLLTLSDLGHHVTLITVEINDYWKNELNKRNVSVFIVPDVKNRNKINKVIEYYKFKRKTFMILSDIITDKNNTFLWVIGGNTIWCLGDKLLDFRLILQIQELHENDNSYLKLFNKIINHAECVFVPEYNRACIFQVWFRMKKRPIVLPNKPYFIDRVDTSALKQYISNSLLEELNQKKIILFQGQIVGYRDLSCFIKAAKEIGRYQVVLLGRHYDGMLKKYQMIDSNIIHISHIPAPTYLAITQMAYICLLTYEPAQLNNIYCAPNKIFEYGAFGKPMIANDLPGLSILKQFQAGILVDDKDVENIKRAYTEIETNYQNFSEGATNLYNSVDNKSTIFKALSVYEK